MTELEKKIEEAAEKYAQSISLSEEESDTTDLDYDNDFHAEIFIAGVKSPEAKAYWQEGMISIKDIENWLEEHRQYSEKPNFYEYLSTVEFEQFIKERK